MKLDRRDMPLIGIENWDVVSDMALLPRLSEVSFDGVPPSWLPKSCA